MTDFTLPPGVEVPELAEWLATDYRNYNISEEVEEESGVTIAALCRVIREQDRMLRTEVAAHCVNGERSPDGVDGCLYCKGRLDALRRRVREEAE